MIRLTRKAFRAWLAAKPRRTFHRSYSHWDGLCPLASWDQAAMIMPALRRSWRLTFMRRIDATVAIGQSITAARCTRILDGIKP